MPWKRAYTISYISICQIPRSAWGKPEILTENKNARISYFPLEYGSCHLNLLAWISGLAASKNSVLSCTSSIRSEWQLLVLSQLRWNSTTNDIENEVRWGGGTQQSKLYPPPKGVKADYKDIFTSSWPRMTLIIILYCQSYFFLTCLHWILHNSCVDNTNIYFCLFG